MYLWGEEYVLNLFVVTLAHSVNSLKIIDAYR